MRLQLFAVVIALAAAAQTPTIDQSLNLKSVSNPKISPDGAHVAYEVQEADWKENAFKTEIHVADVATGHHFQLTNAKKSSNGAAWSPHGSQIPFLSHAVAN